MRMLAATVLVASVLLGRSAAAQTAHGGAAAPSAAPAEAPTAQVAPEPSPPEPAPTPPEVRPAIAPAPPCPACVECPACERPRDDAEGFAAFLIGFGFFDFAEINDALGAAGYETLSGPTMLIGGEGHAILKSGFVIGGRGAAILNPTLDGPGTYEAALTGGFGMLDLGFAPVHLEHLLCTVTAGLGGYGLGLDIENNQPADFGDVLSNPDRIATLSTGGLLVALTLAVDAHVPLPVDPDDESGGRAFFNLGLRAGGLYGPELGDWTLGGDADVSDAPSGALRGGYLLLAVGFGGGTLHGPVNSAN